MSASSETTSYGVDSSRWRTKLDEMNPAPPVTSTRFIKLALDRIERAAGDVALDSAEVLADQGEDEALDSEHEQDRDAAEQRAGEVRVVDPVDDPPGAEREREQRADRPERSPIHWIGCGQKPASTCSAVRTSRSGE